MGDTSNFRNTNTIHPTNVSFSNESHTFADHPLKDPKRSNPITRNTSMHEPPETETEAGNPLDRQGKAGPAEYNLFAVQEPYMDIPVSKSLNPLVHNIEKLDIESKGSRPPTNKVNRPFMADTVENT